MNEIHLIRTVSGFQPCTDQDFEKCVPYKLGSVIRVIAQKPRNGTHHRKGMALLQLGFDYWEPSESYLTAGERYIADHIAKRLESIAGSSGVITEQINAIVSEVEQARFKNIGEVEKSFDAYRKDVTIKAGFYDVEMGVNGIRKKAKSLSYSKMPQEDFSAWYKAVFSVIWKESLSRHFATEAEAESAINEMLNFL